MLDLMGVFEGSILRKIIARKNFFPGDDEDRLVEEITKWGYNILDWNDFGNDHWEIVISQ